MLGRVHVTIGKSKPWNLSAPTEVPGLPSPDALALAQKIKAKAWELRATMSLARLLAKQGKRDEARAILADIYNWFSEAFDTADLKKAKALMDQLGSNV
jgi:predicted ATPase